MLALIRRTGVWMRSGIYSLPAPPVLRSLADLTVRVFRNFSRDDGSHMAAGVAYYAIFSLFPLILGTIAVAGFFINEVEVKTRIFDFLEDQLAGLGSSEMIRSNIESLVQARGALGLVAVIALFWSSRAVFGSVHRVLNRAWKVTEGPHFLLYQVGQVSAAASIAAVFMAAVALGTVGRAIAASTDELLGVGLPWQTIFTTLSLSVSTSILIVVYRFVPDTHVRWRDAVPAAILASVLFELSKVGFAFYLANLSSLDLVYGSVTTIVVLMLFLYVVSMVLVLGAELSSEYHNSSQAGLMVFRGHWRPVKGGLAPLAHRQARTVHPEGLDLAPTPMRKNANGHGPQVHPEGLDLLPEEGQTAVHTEPGAKSGAQSGDESK